MKTTTDRVMLHTAYLYVILPFLIFTIGWLKWYYALIISAAVVISYVLALKQHADVLLITFNKHRTKIFVAIGIILAWVFLSGIGGYSYQNEDHQYRNAILHDLIDHSWPVIYKVDGLAADNPLQGQICLFTYYVGFWMPAAVVGKLLGWQAANFVLYLWSVLGLWLVFYFTCRLMGRFSLRVLIVFMFFSGLYILGSMIKQPIARVLTSDYSLWAGNMVLASGSTEMIFWVFNQCITPWLIIILILNNIPRQNIVFLFSFILLQGPFSFLGFIPFMICIVLKDVFGNSKQGGFLQKLSPFFSLQNICGLLFVFLPTYLYLSGNTAAQHFVMLHLNKVKYLLFCLLSFGGIALIIFPKYRKEPLFYLSIIMLMVLPFFQMGYGIDFSSRVSIPAMFILTVLVIRFVLEETNRVGRSLVIGYLVLAAIEPVATMSRSLVFKCYSYINTAGLNTYLLNRGDEYGYQKALRKETETGSLLIQDDLKTVSNPKNGNMKNFMGVADKSFFYKHLAAHE